ncbi:hypothetical protein [Leptotrichia shahii]|uniref:hypothetical protein n=1 Tax=Leptotrichia shahii TaxID=157691 RepID=UPI0028D84BBA|nr:hypothetical protein [Leptotrichia shahii]
MGNIILIFVDSEIEIGMKIRKLNKDDNHYIKIEEGYKGFFLKVDEIKGVYYDKEEKKFTL